LSARFRRAAPASSRKSTISTTACSEPPYRTRRTSMERERMARGSIASSGAAVQPPGRAISMTSSCRRRCSTSRGDRPPDGLPGTRRAGRRLRQRSSRASPATLPRRSRARSGSRRPAKSRPDRPPAAVSGAGQCASPATRRRSAGRASRPVVAPPAGQHRRDAWFDRAWRDDDASDFTGGSPEVMSGSCGNRRHPA
jgi:hypothetical protein